jgi:hypothetical protein
MRPIIMNGYSFSLLGIITDTQQTHLINPRSYLSRRNRIIFERNPAYKHKPFYAPITTASVRNF